MYLTQTQDIKLRALLKPPRLLLSTGYARFCMATWGLFARTRSRAGQLECASLFKKKAKGPIEVKNAKPVTWRKRNF